MSLSRIDVSPVGRRSITLGSCALWRPQATTKCCKLIQPRSGVPRLCAFVPVRPTAARGVREPRVISTSGLRSASGLRQNQLRQNRL